MHMPGSPNRYTIRVVQIVPRICDEASGPSYSVPSLCSALVDISPDVILHVLRPVQEESKKYKIMGHSTVPGFSKLGISPGMKRALRAEALNGAHIMHNHSLWMLPNVYPASAVRRTSCKLVVSPRGTLSQWSLARSKWLKKSMWIALQGKVLESAHLLHATADTEYDDIRHLGLKAPVALIPNGVDVPAGCARHRGAGERRRLLFLSRIHSKKGVDILLHAWRRVQATAEDWELHIVGPDDGYLSRVQNLATSIGVRRVLFRGPLYGEEKARCYQDADLYVLPTHSENFGITVAEALANGVPAIVSKGAPWSGLETHDCGWWIDLSVQSLAACLRYSLFLSKDELKDRGEKGRSWMKRDYSWFKVAEKMYNSYLWLLQGGRVPDWIITD